MNMETPRAIEETLDPEDWESMRALGHRMLDDMLDYMKTVRERPVWQAIPGEIKAGFKEPVPLDGQPPELVYEEFLRHVLPYPDGNIHPRYWGWVVGTGTVLGALAELLKGTMNTNAGFGGTTSGDLIENQVIDWFKELLGFPAMSSGLLTSGCSAANLIGLAVARNTQARFDLRSKGLQGAVQKMVLYASEEIHSSVEKTVEILALGRDSLRRVPVDYQFQMDLQALRRMITKDRQEGFHPFCVVGAAGTTNTGAIDDLDALADICQREGLWFHVDGAFGAWAALAPGARSQVAGMERADSLAFDLHKWMSMPYEIGCVLVQREQDHRQAFTLTPAYLAHEASGRGITGGDLPWLTDYGFQHSREFRALKAWMSLKEHGSRKYGRLIQQNIDQAHYLGGLIEAAPELELVAPITLNVVCFRYVGPGLDVAVLDRLNDDILVELQEQGIAAPSGTTIRDKYVLRVANTNHRSRRGDFDILVREVLRIGKELA
jgi:aromatic-L-amino-acid decarboxylase